MITRREKLRQAAIDEIKEIAWGMLKENQPVTLIKITKEMGMTAPAFYTYFKSREALMTALVEDALESYYRALSLPFPDDTGPDAAIRISFLRYRTWAVEHESAFSLFAGQPVPGFGNERETALPKAKKIYRFIFDLFYRADKKGMLKRQDMSGFSKSYRNQLSAIQSEMETRLDISMIHQVIRLTSMTHGLISMELSRRFKSLADGESLFRAQVESALADIISNPGWTPPGHVSG